MINPKFDPDCKYCKELALENIRWREMVISSQGMIKTLCDMALDRMKEGLEDEE